MTPQEIAKLPVNSRERRQWLLTASARDIQAFIHGIADNTYAAKEYELARTALEIRIAEDNLKAAEILESHTKSLLLLMQSLLHETKILRWLTVGLLIFTAGLLVFSIRFSPPH